MGKVGWNKSYYSLNGKPIAVYSGTLHYWRTPRDLWRDRLLQMKDAHLNTVDTYVPWNWHEPSEGEIDLRGETDPSRDLEGFLSLLEKLGLYAIVRPGPYICAEWRNGGIPDWLLDCYPEVLAKSSDGSTMRNAYYPPVTLLHPTYLNYVRKWYEAVAPTIRRFSYDRGGPVIAVALDDEPSYWEMVFHPLMADYNEFVVGSDGKPGIYQAYLKDRWGSIEVLNRRYRSCYKGFDEVEPPRKPPGKVYDLPRFLDWHWFKLHMINRFVEHLYKWLKELNVEVPIAILDPYLLVQGWRNFYEYVEERGLEINLWTEFWYSFYRSFDFKEDKLGQTMFKTAVYRFYADRLGCPKLSIETQAFIAHRIEPDEAELLYLTVLGSGISHINFYMMVGGENPRSYGLMNGKTWDLYCPIGLDGSLRPHYHVIERLGRFHKGMGLSFAETEFHADTAFCFYEPYEALEFLGNTAAMGLVENLSAQHEYLFGDRGFLNLLAMSRVAFDALDLVNATVDEMSRYSLLWVYGADFMDEASQRKLLTYVENGGKLVMFPLEPYLDENMNPSTVLKEKLFSAKQVNEVRSALHPRLNPYPKIDFVGDLTDVVVRDYVREFDLKPGMEPIAWNSQTSRPCGYMVRYGKGAAVMLGFKPQYYASFHDLHRRLIWRLLELLDVEPSLRVRGEAVALERRGKGYSYVTLLNPTGEEVKVKLETVVDGTRIVLPTLIDGAGLKTRGGLVIPVNLPVGDSIRVLYATATVENIKTRDGELEIALSNHLSDLVELAMKLPCEAKDLDVWGASVEKKRWDPSRNILTLVLKLRNGRCFLKIFL